MSVILLYERFSKSPSAPSPLSSSEIKHPVNDHIGLNMRGEPLFDWPEGWILAPDGARTKNAAIESFKTSSERIIATVEQMSSEELDATIPTEKGETTRFERCRFMTLHVWYHSGQLNYIQTLLGDDAWHWYGRAFASSAP
jgi:hypothetical protein